MPSTAIQRISYHDERRILFVTFIDGDTYAYFNVAPALYQRFRNAKSKGGFFAREVRDRFSYQKVEASD